MQKIFTTMLAIALSAGSIAAAPGATGCVDGPAHAATAERPHTADAAGDTYYVQHDQADVRAAWVGVHASPAGDPVYTAHLAATSLSDGTFPVSTFYELRVLGTRLGAWVAADGTVEFGEWAVWATAPFTQGVGVGKLRDLPGKFDADLGVVSVEIPADVAPGAGEVVTTSVQARVGRGAESPQSYGLAERVVLTLDTSEPDGTCTAVLDGLPTAD